MFLEEKDLKDGMRITCFIEGIRIKNATVSIDKSGRVYICQNEKDGSRTEDRKGYKYSWIYDYMVSEVEETAGSMDSLMVGDFIVAGEDIYRRVLAVIGEVIITSKEVYSEEEFDPHNSRFYETYSFDTVEELKIGGFTFFKTAYAALHKEDKETVVTLDEVAKKFGVDVKKLKIKKD